jgi:hypothetical protein
LTPLFRKLHDERLREVWAPCPDDGHVLVPTGDMYSRDESGRLWSIAFRCPEHMHEILRIWRPEFEPLIDEILAGIDVDSLPLVDRPT